MLLSSRAWLDSNIKRPEFFGFLFIACWKSFNLVMGMKAVEKTAFILVSLFGEILRNYKIVFLLAAPGTMIFLSRRYVLNPIQSKC